MSIEYFSFPVNLGCHAIQSFPSRNVILVNQYFQGDIPGTISVRDGIEVPFEFHQRVPGYGRTFQFVVRIFKCWQWAHLVSLFDESLSRYVRTTIYRMGVDLGQAFAEPIHSFLEGLE